MSKTAAWAWLRDLACNRPFLASMVLRAADATASGLLIGYTGSNVDSERRLRASAVAAVKGVVQYVATSRVVDKMLILAHEKAIQIVTERHMRALAITQLHAIPDTTISPLINKLYMCRGALCYYIELCESTSELAGQAFVLTSRAVLSTSGGSGGGSGSGSGINNGHQSVASGVVTAAVCVLVVLSVALHNVALLATQLRNGITGHDSFISFAKQFNLHMRSDALENQKASSISDSIKAYTSMHKFLAETPEYRAYNDAITALHGTLLSQLQKYTGSETLNAELLAFVQIVRGRARTISAMTTSLLMMTQMYLLTIQHDVELIKLTPSLPEKPFWKKYKSQLFSGPVLQVDALDVTLKSRTRRYTLASRLQFDTHTWVRVTGESGVGKSLVLLAAVVQGARPYAIHANAYTVYRWGRSHADKWNDSGVAFFEMYPYICVLGSRQIMCMHSELRIKDIVSESSIIKYNALWNYTLKPSATFGFISDGERQAVSVMMLLDCVARVWILDEFLSAIDPERRVAVRRSVRIAAAKRSALVFETAHYNLIDEPFSSSRQLEPLCEKHVEFVHIENGSILIREVAGLVSCCGAT